MTPQELVDVWCSVSPEQLPYALPDDLDAIRRAGCVESSSHKAFREAYPLPGMAGARFHLGLIPTPYLGSLDHATVFILMLNPGFGPLDYFAEEKDRSYRAALWNNLRQAPSDYPFLFLDPAFSYTGGFQYWTRKDKLGWILEAMIARGTPPLDALKELSRRICVLQPIAYHSAHFESTAALQALPSTTLLTEFVWQSLLPRAQRGEAVILVLRKVRAWGLPESDHVICYKSSQARGAKLGPGSGAEAPLRRFLLATGLSTG